MENVAIVYATQYGQTQKIAEVMAKRLKELHGTGVNVSLIEVSRNSPDPDFPKGTDTVIIGAPVMAGQYPRRMKKWVRKHLGDLACVKSAFYSVSLNAADARTEMREVDRVLLVKFQQETGWSPDYRKSLAGALKYLNYGWFVKRIMQKISAAAGGPTDTSKNYELTDWAAVNEFVEKVVPTSRHVPPFVPRADHSAVKAH